MDACCSYYVAPRLTEINNIIYKDKIFCTNQAINQSNDEYYSVNKDHYISEESSDNEFIII